MSKIGTIQALEKFGRVRLSRHFFMQDFLYSEISNFHSIPNIPDEPDLAIAVGEKLCQELLDPLFETFGNISIRSSYRSPGVNQYGNENHLNCASNASNHAGHIWDKLDANGERGATTCIVIPWFADQYEAGRDWRDLAWWIHDHLLYSGMYFHPIRAAFNLSWRDVPERTISSYIKPLGKLLAAGDEPEETLEQRRERYADFPAFRGIVHP
ncbi:MAG: hypothetical protein JKY82_01900 [Rhizobiaceae bacterium]|nr:hypothetical protein [Rhizobiaceae bacterium]